MYIYQWFEVMMLAIANVIANVIKTSKITKCNKLRVQFHFTVPFYYLELYQS